MDRLLIQNGHQNTFMTRHDCISSKLIDNLHGVIVYGVNPIWVCPLQIPKIRPKLPKKIFVLCNQLYTNVYISLVIMVEKIDEWKSFVGNGNQQFLHYFEFIPKMSFLAKKGPKWQKNAKFNIIKKLKWYILVTQ